MKYLFFIFVSVVIFLSCKKDKVGFTPTPYELNIPSHFPDMIIPEDNCHSPSASFSDPSQFSVGIDGIPGTRNSMALINLGWQNFFFWDGRAKTLEDQILEPIPNPIEMHQEWKDAVAKLNSDKTYRNMFFKAFGQEGIDSLKVSKAIAQFLRTMISGSSKYDVMYKYENSLPLNSIEQSVYASVTAEEWAGYDLFKSLNGADCFHCHNGPLMQVQKFSNNGLDATFIDHGRNGVTGNPADDGKFKVPTLRNIALSGPYMHDGRFNTLEEVIEHYSSGIQMSSTIDPMIEFASQGGVQLDAFEKDLLKKFLQTLTDYDFITNPDFQDPD